MAVRVILVFDCIADIGIMLVQIKLGPKQNLKGDFCFQMFYG